MNPYSYRGPDGIMVQNNLLLFMHMLADFGGTFEPVRDFAEKAHLRSP